MPYFYVAIMVVLVLACLVLWQGTQKQSVVGFAVANRKIPTLITAISIAMVWTWGLAMLVPAQKAYGQGLVGLLWFVLPNACALLAVALLAKLAPRQWVRHGYSIVEYVEQKYDVKTKLLYTAVILLLDVYAVSIQLTAASLLLYFSTGLDINVVVITLAIAMLITPFWRGIRASIVSDMIKASLVFVLAVLGLVAIQSVGGLDSLAGGLANKSNATAWDIATNFGIPVTISLIASSVIKQELWQRMFVVSRVSHRVYIPYLVAAGIFLVVTMSIGGLGLLASSGRLNITIDNPQLVGFATLSAIMPAYSSQLIAFAFTVALVATGSSSINSTASIAATDLYRQFSPTAGDSKRIWVGRVAMVMAVIFGSMVAMLGVELITQLIFVGSIRGVLLIPTVMMFFGRQPQSNFVFWGSVIGIAAGQWFFWNGMIFESSVYPLAVSAVFCVLGVMLTKAQGTKRLSA